MSEGIIDKSRRPSSSSKSEARDGWRDEMSGVVRDWVSSWREVLAFKSLPQDVMAGLTVAAVALPLNVALAVASGLPPSAGLLSGAIGGGLAAIFGGAKFQVTGPAAALSTLVLAIYKDFGPAGAAGAALIVGVMQLGLALATAGRLARFVPESVLAGFTTGVGLKLLDNQIPELMGFDYKVIEIAQMMHRPEWLHEVSWISVVLGLGVAFLVVTTKPFKRFPGALVGIVVTTFLAVYLKWPVERVGEVPSTLPPFTFPNIPDDKWIELHARVIPLGILAAIESLLSAKGLDRMSNTTHNPNLELFGQGIANVASGFFTGMPVTGVVVRSSVNVQSGGKTRLSSLLHAVALLGCVLLVSEQIAQIPLAALAGLLCVIGVRLIELNTLVHLAKHERIEAVAFVVTAVGTVTGHLMLGLVSGLAIHGVRMWLDRGKESLVTQAAEQKALGIRAVLHADAGEARRPEGYTPAPRGEEWLSHIRERAIVPGTAFVHHQATVIGRVVMGEHVHIAAGSSVRADEGSPFHIGASSNIQDGVVIHALKNRRVMVGGEAWAVFVGKNVSIAHDALVHGPCYIGDDTFVGFKAVVHDSVVGAHCYIGIGAVVVGVEIPDGLYVPHGTIVDSADAVDRLLPVSEAQREFNEDVVDVNRGLAVAYHQAARPKAIRPRNGHDLATRESVDPWDAAWKPSSSSSSSGTF